MIQILHILLILFAIVLADDPWPQAQELMSTMVKRSDPIADLSNDPHDKLFNTGVSFTVPMDYIPKVEQTKYEQFWDNEITPEQLKLYESLKISSDMYNNADATLILSNMFLYQDYGFPHNKTLAFQYMDKYNNMTRLSNSETVFEQAVMYSTGLFGAIERDEVKSLIYYQKAAKLGNLKAKQTLAYKHIHGINVPKDYEKGLLLYREIAHVVRSSYNEYQWEFVFPYIETFNIRLPDFDNGLLDADLKSTPLSTYRKVSVRPDITSSVLTKMSNGNIVLQFGNLDETSPFAIGGIEDESDDQLVDLYYNAWDEFKGTYTMERNCEAARQILEFMYDRFHKDVPFMDTLQLFFYSKGMDLLGHIYMTGDGIERENIDLATKYFQISIDSVENKSSVKSRANIGMGLINEFYKNNITEAVRYYMRGKEVRENGGIAEYQLSKLCTLFPEMKIGDPFQFMQTAHMKGYLPARFEFAKMVEQGLQINYIPEDLGFIFKEFVERNENIMAPHLKTAFNQLLLGNTEVSLWLYSIAAEQGYEAAQVSAAYLMYQIPFKFEELPITEESRKQLASSYYTRAFKQDNIDSGIIAGDIYYNTGEYEKAFALYQAAALKLSSQGIWNLGYMYEYGLGVPMDYHLAKRYYDQLLDTKPKLFIAASLSILKLQIKSVWKEFHDKYINKYPKLQLITMKINQKLHIVEKFIISNFLSHKPFHETVVQNETYKQKSNTPLGNVSMRQQEDKVTDDTNPTRVDNIREHRAGDAASTDTIWGIQQQDLSNILFMLMVFVVMLVVRTLAQRGDWNIRVNGIPLNNANANPNGNPNPNNPDNANPNPNPRNEGFQLDLQFFAI